MRPVTTFLCPVCQRTTVADRDGDGFPVCGLCDSSDGSDIQAQVQSSDLYSPTVKRLSRQFSQGLFDRRLKTK